MDPIKNPFSPGAGSPPPELVGRQDIIEQARILLGRTKMRKSEKSLLLTGLRGVGKTVLLNDIERTTLKEGYRSILVEAHEDKPLAVLLVPHLRRLFFDLDRAAGAGDKAKRGLAILKSFLSGIKVTVGEVEIGLDIDPEQGAADSGDLEADLPNLLVAVGEAAEERDSLIVILIDEIQYFSEKELSALIMAMHKIQQRQLPLVLIGAGLPILARLAGDSKSYAERLFAFPNLGPLTCEDCIKALQEPVKAAGIEFQDAALDLIYRLTQGYPYFLQEWGYQCWNSTDGPIIRLEDVEKATSKVIPRLDNNFFRVRFDRLTQGEKKYLRAMAELGPGPYKSGDVAMMLHVKVTSLGPVRAQLIKKGMIYSPVYGEMAFTVPLFDSYMRRVMPELPEK